MKIYTTPFLTSWPIPFSLKEIIECFKDKPAKKINSFKRKIIDARGRIQNVNIKSPLYNI